MDEKVSEELIAAGRGYESLFVPALFEAWTKHLIEWRWNTGRLAGVGRCVWHRCAGPKRIGCGRSNWSDSRS